ncbi:hypothetical protein WA026_017805 [Henosepilachna vigintioctopunctata]|uniref:ascorbate ferrireductase (transmembrane) n=1 Tax=Henosepilachna vigintioctopunctata TaxID=420089 RepID=A0AAW1TW72_9CUCU
MGETTKVKTKDKTKKKQNEPSDVHALVQVFEFVFVILILVLIFTSEFSIMNIHVFYSNIGWMVLMVQGLLVFHGISPIVKKIFGNDTIFIHWLMETIALVGASIAFICAYQDKENKNKYHFVTWHGIFGLIGYSLCMLSGLNGVPTLYRKELKKFISPKWMKFVHILTGTIGFFFGALALVMSCYTKWFAKRTSSSLISFIIALFLVSSVVIWTIVRPVTKVRSNWKKLTAKAEQ